MKYRLFPAFTLCAVFLSDCGKHEVRTTVVAEPPPRSMDLHAELLYRQTIDHPAAVGISGSCRRSTDTWYVGERNGTLLGVDDSGTMTEVNIAGLPPGIDLEGLACAGGRFYLSTESRVENRSSDLILIVEAEGGTARVAQQFSVQYPTKLVVKDNQGLEGLCIAGDWLIAAAEVVRTVGGLRQAPIMRQKLNGTEASIHWLNLSSSTGKLSGLDCRMRGSEIEIFAIERHYEVGRVLHFILGDTVSEPETILDLEYIIDEEQNFEAITVDDLGQVHLVNDNQHSVVTGTTQEAVLAPVSTFSERD